jgi:hypothetical protein
MNVIQVLAAALMLENEPSVSNAYIEEKPIPHPGPMVICDYVGDGVAGGWDKCVAYRKRHINARKRQKQARKRQRR